MSSASSLICAGRVCSGAKQPEREADLSLPSSVEFTSAWRYPLPSPVCLGGLVFGDNAIALVGVRLY
jgi:hypothetical protein